MKTVTEAAGEDRPEDFGKVPGQPPREARVRALALLLRMEEARNREWAQDLQETLRCLGEEEETAGPAREDGGHGDNQWDGPEEQD